jgi:hypothetical protein
MTGKKKALLPGTTGSGDKAGGFTQQTVAARDEAGIRQLTAASRI